MSEVLVRTTQKEPFKFRSVTGKEIKTIKTPVGDEHYTVVTFEYIASFWNGWVGKYETSLCKDAYIEYKGRKRICNTAPSVSYFDELKKALKL